MVSAMAVDPALAVMYWRKAEPTIMLVPDKNSKKSISWIGNNDLGVIAGKNAEKAYILLVRDVSFCVWLPAINLQKGIVSILLLQNILVSPLDVVKERLPTNYDLTMAILPPNFVSDIHRYNECFKHVTPPKTRFQKSFEYVPVNYEMEQGVLLKIHSYPP